jgi:PIN domain nuclease of toxin-antitoxin system
MRVLLDTHAFLWFVAGDARLSTRALTAIADPTTKPFLSAASIWEMAIKMSIGKLNIAAPFKTFIPAQMQRNGIALLGITVDHATQVISLPFHHRDPFDRLLGFQSSPDLATGCNVPSPRSLRPTTRGTSNG